MARSVELGSLVSDSASADAAAADSAGSDLFSSELKHALAAALPGFAVVDLTFALGPAGGEDVMLFQAADGTWLA